MLYCTSTSTLPLSRCTLHVKRGRVAPIVLNRQVLLLWDLTSRHMHAHSQSERQRQDILISSAGLNHVGLHLTVGLGRMGHGGSDGCNRRGERGRSETVGRREMGANEKILGKIDGKRREGSHEDFGRWSFGSATSWRPGTSTTIWGIKSGMRTTWSVRER